ncbi:MAG: hypothetical protein NZ805_14675 [Armatimonadetes bacterium]|nr:hypothetical protein [Armatimonadota bacterium]MDW8029758.1 hypothetical protein [Armatimonadota bacterium]
MVGNSPMSNLPNRCRSRAVSGNCHENYRFVSEGIWMTVRDEQ